MANFFKNIQSLKNCEEMHIFKTSAKHQDSNVNILAFACSLNGKEYEGTLTKSVTEKLMDEKDKRGFNAKAFFIEEGQLGEAEKIDDETGEVSTCFCIFSKASREELLSF